MYTAVLMLAISTGGDTIDHGRRGGCCSSYGGCSGYYGGCQMPYYSGCCGGGGGYARPGYSYYPASGYYSAPTYSYSPGTFSNSTTVLQPSGTNVRQAFYSGPNQDSVMVTVILPNPDAEVWFDNAPTMQRGTRRLFTSPAGLQAGVNYRYTIKARWMENGRPVDQERLVDIQPGQATTVTFQSSGSEPLASPKTLQNK